jgi:kinesin family protein C1
MKQLELGKSIARVEELEEQLKAGDVARRKLHNMIQELRGNVRVFARVRPFLPNDGVDTEASQPTIIPRSDETSLRIYKEQTTENRGEDHAFSFDKVFGPCSSQELVFNEVSEFVQSALDGYHVCLFSYGQTGSGKTHTMQGSGTGSMRGIVARAMEQVGQYKAELEEKGWEYSMEVSFLEIYNENIRDLLRSTPSDELKHDIKRDAQGNVTVTDLTKMKVDPKDTDQMNMIMDIAARHRSVGTTAMNARSSRSHSVFCLHLKACNAKQGLVLKGALNLVDLAGSERLDRSGATGDRMKETVAINKSLSSLTDVFVAIGNKQSHIPFRNSKLTYLLQPALSGDGKTLMMVNLSPTEASFQESLCSLRFAAQVNKCELGKPKKNTSNYSDESGKPSAASTGTSRVQGNKRSKR